MIHGTEDLADDLRHALARAAAGEAIASEVTTSAFVVPPVSVFFVRVVEGRRFRVTVTEDPERSF